MEGIVFIQASFSELNAGHWCFCASAAGKSKHLAYTGMGGFEETVVMRKKNIFPETMEIEIFHFCFALK